jgi:xylulokinase
VPHGFSVPSPLRFQHDAACWWDGPRRALHELDAPSLRARAVSVAAMVPSLTAVGDDGRPIGIGLLYGDERGHVAPNAPAAGHPGESGELGRFLAWLAREHPEARGFWPAQAVANASLSGTPSLSTSAAAACYPLFDFHGWNEPLVSAAGARVEQMPVLVPQGQPGGEVLRDLVGDTTCVVEGGTIDAMGEQVVAGADDPGDVLVICGTTLIVWCVTAEPADVPGYFPIPHTTPGRFLVGGPSNAGGLFLDWARRMTSEPTAATRPDSVPVWVPYPRGERVPLNDVTRRAQLVDLDLTHDSASVRRAAFEAAGFVTRRIIEASPVPATRIVATGGGVRVPEWISALADCTGLPVDVVAVPEGGALGAAWLGRIAVGAEADLAGARRWARTARRVEPDPAWQDAADRRYQRFLELAS